MPENKLNVSLVSESELVFRACSTIETKISAELSFTDLFDVKTLLG